MKTLIITVGTRQVGWRCKDGIVRCLGADGGRNDPRHIDELYSELGIERGNHQDEGVDRTYPWSVWDLGQRLLEQCQCTNFSRVELLLDRTIIAEQLGQGLSHVILWGTRQPDCISWSYRRMDTVGLAELMAGKLQEIYPQLKVKVFTPVLNAVAPDQVRDTLENHILPFALQTRSPDDQEFTLLVENKGATPAVSEGLGICAGALVRDCQVVNITPIEPKPLYRRIDDKTQEACTAYEYRQVNLSSYFWPLERSRIISAWRRGDFREAQIWLSSHREHAYLYELAENLSLATNWQIDETLKKLKNWINPRAVRHRIATDLYSDWQQRLHQLCLQGGEMTPISKFLKIWESCFLIQLELNRQNVTAAFIHFSQTLERLLFLRYQSEDWIANGYLAPPLEKQSWGIRYRATLAELRVAWQKQQRLSDDAPIPQQLERVNELRNGVVHRGEPKTLPQLARDLFPSLQDPSAMSVYSEMDSVLRAVCPSDWPIPAQPILQHLYQWGLDILMAESAQGSLSPSHDI